MGQGLEPPQADIILYRSQPQLPSRIFLFEKSKIENSPYLRCLIKRDKIFYNMELCAYNVYLVAMEPPGVLPPDKEKERYLLQQQLHQQQLLQLQQHQPQQHSIQQLQLLNQQQQQFTVPSPNQLTTTTSIGVSATAQQTIERLSRPMAFDKMEILVREMQDSEVGVPVRSQKLFLTSIPSAFMGYDLIEWLMERLGIEESEALNLANQLCLHGYFFPVNDSKTLVVKDDSSLYRFQTPYYWPWQHKAPDNVEYAIYLAKRSLRNKQRHGLEDYESEALTSLHKNLKGKWDFITMQAEEQVKLAKERKKGDKIVGDSQERAYWRVHRPPPGQFTPLEPCPVPSRDRQGKPRRRTVDDWQRDVDFLKASLGRTRMKMSQACESLVQYYEIFTEYDPLMQPALPSNPWVTEDITFWQQNSNIVDVPTEKRIKRWGISIEELVSDPTGLQEFTAYLKKEYSHENIRFWLAVNDLRRSAHSQIPRKVKEIYEEFLEPGAPCEINIDSKTMEKVQQGLKSPTRFTFDAAAEHIYALLLKKDCYPRFIRSEHYKLLLASGLQPAHKKRFFVFGGVAKKKSTTIPPNQALLNQIPGSSSGNASGNLGRRRGSDRSLSGSAHELAVSGVKDGSSKVPHSHSQSNLSDIPYRGDMPSGGSIIPEQSEVPINVVASALPGGYDKTKTQEPSKSFTDSLETTLEGSVGGNGSGGGACAICPWDVSTEIIEPSISVSVCPWDEDSSNTVPMPIGPSKSSTAISTRPTSASPFDIGSTTQDINEVSERMRRSCGLRQNTLDCDFPSSKRLMPAITEQRRASVTIAPRSSDLQFSPRQSSLGIHGIFSSAPLPFTENYSASQLSLPISTLLGIEDKSGNSGGKKKSSVATEETMKKGTKGSTTSGIASTSANNVLKQQQKISSSTDESFIDSKKNLPSNNFVEKETIINDDNDEAKTINILSNKNNEVLSNNKNSVNYNISSSSLSSELTGLVPSQLMITATMTSSPSSQGTTPIINVCPIVDEEEELKIIAEQQQFQQESSGQQEITEMTDDNKSLMTESSQANIPSFSSSSSPSTITQGTVSTPTATIVEEEDETTNLPSNKMMMINVKSDLNIQDELSPTTDDYRECVQYQEQNTSEDYDYEIVDEGGNNLAPGCVAPAPTPAPSIAPLAEVEQDPQDDDDDDDDNNDNNTVDNVICGHEDVDVEITTSQPDVAIAAGNDDDDDNIRTGNVRIDDDDNDNGGDTSRQQSVEIEEVEMKPETSAAAAAATDVTRKKRKKRDSESKRSADDLKEQPKKDDQQMTHDIQTTTTSKASKDEDPKRNPVCPWEDEDMSGTVDAPFVKTYATLGYL